MPPVVRGSAAERLFRLCAVALRELGAPRDAAHTAPQLAMRPVTAVRISLTGCETTKPRGQATIAKNTARMTFIVVIIPGMFLARNLSRRSRCRFDKSSGIGAVSLTWRRRRINAA
jgi:hypothetical protein